MNSGSHSYSVLASLRHRPPLRSTSPNAIYKPSQLGSTMSAQNSSADSSITMDDAAKGRKSGNGWEGLANHDLSVGHGTGTGADVCVLRQQTKREMEAGRSAPVPTIFKHARGNGDGICNQPRHSRRLVNSTPLPWIPNSLT